MTNFADGLKAYLTQAQAADTEVNLFADRQTLLDFLNSPPSKRKERILARMERRARTELGLTHNEGQDWSAAAIDWSAIISWLLPLLLMILKAFLIPILSILIMVLEVFLT